MGYPPPFLYGKSGERVLATKLVAGTRHFSDAARDTWPTDRWSLLAWLALGDVLG